MPQGPHTFCTLGDSCTCAPADMRSCPKSYEAYGHREIVRTRGAYTPPPPRRGYTIGQRRAFAWNTLVLAIGTALAMVAIFAVMASA